MHIRLISFLLIIVFFCQHLAYGSTILLPYSPQVVAEMVSSFNALTQEERKAEFKKVKQQLSFADQLFVEKNFPEEQIQWPDLKFEDGDISFTLDGKTVSFSIWDQKMFIKGKTVNLQDKSLQNTAAELEKILTEESSSTSLLDLLIPSAYAAFWVPVIIAIMAISFAYTFFLKPAFSNIRKNFIVKTKCLEIMQQLEANDLDKMSANDAQTLLSKAQSIAEQKHTEIKQNCADSKKDQYCQELRKTKSCYQDIADVVEPKAKQGNGSSRSWIKDMIFGKPKSSASSTATGR